VELAVDLVATLIIAALAAGAASRFGLSAPLVLTALGLVLSFVPGMPSLELEPEIVLIGILPPLLYATAIRTPYVDLRRNRRPIALLSIGLVVATALAVAVVVRMVLPDIPFAVALALGAVVAPPDAVAASAVARRVRMPRKVVTLLEGESLLNDATALVTLRTALAAAAAAGSISLFPASGDFVLAAGAGALAGWVLAEIVSVVRRRVEDPVLDTALSLIAPYVAYLAAEEVHGSGVIAVVVAGLILGHRSPEIQSAASRVTERTIWRTVQFLLESTVFLLIGLQLKDLVQRAIESSETGNGDVVLLCVAVLGTVVIVRFAWVIPGTYLPRLIPAIARAEPRPPLNNVVLVAWAGMRGVVTLAAAVTIPEDTPQQPALVLAAFAVVAGTLLLQGTTLPWMVRLLRVQGPDPAQDALQAALVQQRAGRAALERLDQEGGASDRPEVVAGLRDWGERVANAAWERLGSSDAERETPAAAFHRLRVAMLDAERKVITDARRTGAVPGDIVEQILERVDQEEAMLEGFSAGSEPVSREILDGELAGRLADAASTGAAKTADAADSAADSVAAPAWVGTDHAAIAEAGANGTKELADASGHRAVTALGPARPGAAHCEHLTKAPSVITPTTSPDACPGCLELGEHSWVHLRMCLTCGQIGCCDSSPNRHAERHFQESGHPVMRSVELGESWRWCYVDAELG
jgi:monovalent cation/hydrogen antiporter